MNVFDMHIHADLFGPTAPDPEGLLSRMAQAGVYGGCLFSGQPTECSAAYGMAFSERLDRILAWTSAHPDRLFPILWVHPREDGIKEKLHEAAARGILGFKVMCSDFYVYDDACLEMLSEIAALDRPVLFHTGILWDGAVSACYNRPMNWEALIDIPNIRFSMGHCSWPWHDECIALYGKFLNALEKGKSAEMFLDLTPGTPELYREELLTKIFTVGYDVPHNLLYGTDGLANDYKSAWTSRWLSIDGRIMDKLGVSPKTRGRLFSSNLMRFLGLSRERVERFVPKYDEQTVWSPKADV